MREISEERKMKVSKSPPAMTGNNSADLVGAVGQYHAGRRHAIATTTVDV